MDQEHDQAQSEMAKIQVKKNCDRTFFKLFQAILFIFGLIFLIGTIIILVNNPNVVTDSKLQHMFLFIVLFVVLEVFFPLLFLFIALTCKCCSSSGKKARKGGQRSKKNSVGNRFYLTLFSVAIAFAVVFSFMTIIWGFIIFSLMGSSLFQKYFFVHYYAVYILYWASMSYSIFIILIYALQLFIRHVILSPYCCEGQSACGDLCNTNDLVEEEEEEEGTEEIDKQQQEMKEAPAPEIAVIPMTFESLRALGPNDGSTLASVPWGRK